MIIAQIATPSSPAPSRAMEELTRIYSQAVADIQGDIETAPTAEVETARGQNLISWKVIHLLAIDGDIGNRMESPYGFPLLAGSAEGVALWGEEGGHPVSITPEHPWDGEAVGMASVQIPLKENLDSAYIDINVTEGYERAYGELWDAAQTILRAEGRTKVSAYADQPFGDDLVAPSSSLSLQKTRYSDFLLFEGFDLTQTETCSRLVLPPDQEVISALRSEALEKSGAYRTISWSGPTPEEYREDMVAMLTAFNMDMPNAGIVDPEINYDVARLIEGDKRTERTGLTNIITAAQHIETGHLVGYTRLELEPGRLAAIQEDTVVLKEHRGHRIGLLVKTENLRQLKDIAPERTYIQTWNAGENAWMCAINERLGFRAHTGVGLWQKDLSRA